MQLIEDARRAALVVAHADDETLWAGGLLLRYPERWKIICCSIPRSDPIRAYKFFDACAALGAEGRLLPFHESAADAGLSNLAALDLTPFDAIVTHNSVGEYGHFQHRHLHRFIAERWPAKTATFGYRPDGRGKQVLHLSAGERAQKLVALKCYDHISPHDGGKPKWQALLDRYAIDMRTETFDVPA